ncbi:hypothetical protein CDAR_491041 [Caerostris darwini]|uniref:BTB domain-containing protein n=1 Tax=Caerostris darwini TaxID=1538125 RepID=A0AAV4X878_9ARAC|nr:hypothetical protein CDAR_491041 [Caerostris darwini]
MVIDQVAENSNPLEFSIPAAVGENDVVGALFQKFVSLSQRQDRVEYAGGIWDNTAMDMLPSVPVAAETRNSMNRIFSLDEMIECEEEMDGNTSLEIEESPNMACNFLMANDSSSPVQIPDAKIKRSMSSEGENILFPKIDAERKANKKRTKKTVTFSDNIVIYKDSTQKISCNTDASELCSEEVDMSNAACDPKQNLNFEKPKKSDNRKKLTFQSNGLSSSLHQHSVQIQSTDKIRLELKETKKESNKESCAMQHNQNFPISEKKESSLNHPNSVISKPFKEKKNESIENVQVSHKEAKIKKKKVPHEKTIHDSISVIEPVKIKLQSKAISSSTEQFHAGKKSEDESQNKTFNKDQHPNCWENLVSYLFNDDSETNKKIASCKSPVKMTTKDILNDKTTQDNKVIIEQASFHSGTNSETTSARKSCVKRGQSHDVNVDFLEKKKVDVCIVDDSFRKLIACETVSWRNHQPPGELNQKDFVSSKSKSLNWREDCIDVREARKNSNFRADDNIMMDNSKVFSHIISDEKVDVHKKTVNFISCSKEPLDPLTRFKNNALPESIWDEPNGDLKNEKPVQEDPPALPKSKNSVPIFYESSKKLLQKDEKEKQQLPAKKLYYSESTKFDNRARSSYSSYRNSSAMKDVKVIVKIFNQEGEVFEKFHILKDDLLDTKKKIWGLSNIVPDQCNKPTKINCSASSVNLFLRCVFSMSYRIPNWQTALEAFAIAKKFKVQDLLDMCKNYFINQKIPPREIPEIARFAKSLNVVEALKESKIFEKVQDAIKKISSLNSCAAGNCSVSTAIHVEPSEFKVPLVFEDVQNLSLINVSDLKNTILFKSISGSIRVMSIELKLRTEEFSVGNQDLIIYCDIYKGSDMIFNEEFIEKPKPVIKISFEDEIIIDEEEEIEIAVLVDDISLQLCPQLNEDDYASRKFHLKFKSDKKNEDKKLFFIHKLLYSHQGF